MTMRVVRLSVKVTNVRQIQRGLEAERPLTCAFAESEEASRALVIRVWEGCDFSSGGLNPQICPKNWPSMAGRRNGPCDEWSLLFSGGLFFVARPPLAKCTINEVACKTRGKEGFRHNDLTSRCPCAQRWHLGLFSSH